MSRLIKQRRKRINKPLDLKTIISICECSQEKRIHDIANCLTKESENRGCIATVRFENYTWGITKEGKVYFCCRKEHNSDHIEERKLKLKKIISKWTSIKFRKNNKM